VDNYKNRFIVILISLLWNSAINARGVYQTPQAFLKETYQGKIPKAKFVWLTKDVKPQVNEILGHPLNALRVRYWVKGKRTAWILEEIGKEELITTGIVVNKGNIERVKILVFRESRGWEVRYPFFTDQFKNVKLTARKKLSRPIDSISGATLSVNAVSRLARLALYFHKLAIE